MTVSTRLQQATEGVSQAVKGYLGAGSLDAIIIAYSSGSDVPSGSDIPILELDVSTYGTFRRGLFGGLSVAIRRVNSLANLYNDMKFRKIFLLPRRNCQIVSNLEMKDIFVSRFLDKSYEFMRDFQEKISEIRRYERPKETKRYEDKHFFDGKMYFQYGHEKHSKVECEGGNHNFMCFVAAKVRFSIIYDGSRHYNVSDGKNGSLKGMARPICHDGGDYVASETNHLNIFPNDFIA